MTPTTGASTIKPATSVVNADRQVEDWARKRILEVMNKRGLKDRDVTRELGVGPHDTSLWRAIRPPSIKLALAANLEKWLHDNRRV